MTLPLAFLCPYVKYGKKPEQYVRKDKSKETLHIKALHVRPSMRIISLRQARQGSLAQLVEQLAFNQLVVGSNPTRPTIILDYS